jgi:hypothetical protein
VGALCTTNYKVCLLLLNPQCHSYQISTNPPFLKRSPWAEKRSPELCARRTHVGKSTILALLALPLVLASSIQARFKEQVYVHLHCVELVEGRGEGLGKWEQRAHTDTRPASDSTCFFGPEWAGKRVVLEVDMLTMDQWMGFWGKSKV